jgi:acyl dehydratase
MQQDQSRATVSALKQPRYFEDVTVGDALDDLQKGPFTTPHLFRWSAAIENWHKIHYDRDFAQQHDKLPDLLVNGSLKQNFLLQIIKDWATHHGWPWKVGFQFRAMDVVGTTLFVWGKVVGKMPLEDYGLVELELGIRNQDGKQSTPGKAMVALPYRNGPAVPYPFIPPDAAALHAARSQAEAG